MAKLLMLKGLPASGKTTYAKELVKKGWKRVNKDDLRSMIDDGKWSKKNEEQIVDTQEMIVDELLANGFNVVVDDTNFHSPHEEKWRNRAGLHNAQFEVKFFDTPYQECIERDAKRGHKCVGKRVITEMYMKYLYKEAPPVELISGLSSCCIFDIDGTLAKMNGRSPYDYTLVKTDTLVVNIKEILDDLWFAGNEIIIVSGRTDDCMVETKKWLEDKGILYSKIFMRKSGDMRKDAIIKKEIYENEIKGKYNVIGVFDDRDQVVEMWRSLGLTCLQVNYGNF